jgi:hypothetical protein
MLSKVRLWGPSWSKGRTAEHVFGSEPSNDYQDGGQAKNREKEMKLKKNLLL